MEPSDVELLYKWENDQRLWQSSSTLQSISRADLQKFIENSSQDIYESRQMRLMIEDKTRTTVGCIDLFDFDPFHLHASIGVVIAEEYRQQNLASEAVTAFVAHCFSFFGIRAIEATIASDNEASVRLFERCGFRRAGLRPRWLRRGKAQIDEIIYVLTDDAEE